MSKAGAAIQDRRSNNPSGSSSDVLAEAMDNMPIGVIMFDVNGQLSVCNRRYIEMYALSEGIVKPGCTLRDLIQHRKDVGLFSGNVAQYCADIERTIKKGETAHQYITTTDGRSINVVNQPIPSGGWIATHEDVTSYRSAVAQIEYLSHYDDLTGLANRGLFNVHLSEALLMSSAGQRVAIHMINLHDFRFVNGTLGYPVGDAILREFVERLVSCVGEHDFVARLGGDQFGVIQMLVRQPHETVTMAKRIMHAASVPYSVADQDISVEPTIGVAVALQDDVSPDDLLTRASFALSAANLAGSGAIRSYQPGMAEQLLTRQRLLARRKIELELASHKLDVDASAGDLPKD